MSKTKARIEKDIVIKDKYKFRLEIYLALEGHNEFCWEIFPQDYESSLYAMSDKEELYKIIRSKHIYEKIKSS